MEITSQGQYELAEKRIAEIHATYPQAYVCGPPEIKAQFSELVESTCRYERDEYKKLGPIINRLYEKRVFGISFEGGEVELYDGCDECFGLVLSKTELTALSAEILAIANTLPE